MCPTSYERFRGFQQRHVVVNHGKGKCKLVDGRHLPCVPYFDFTVLPGRRESSMVMGVELASAESKLVSEGRVPAMKRTKPLCASEMDH